MEKRKISRESRNRLLDIIGLGAFAIFIIIALIVHSMVRAKEGSLYWGVYLLLGIGFACEFGINLFIFIDSIKHDMKEEKAEKALENLSKEKPADTTVYYLDTKLDSTIDDYADTSKLIYKVPVKKSKTTTKKPVKKNINTKRKTTKK